MYKFRPQQKGKKRESTNVQTRKDKQLQKLKFSTGIRQKHDLVTTLG